MCMGSKRSRECLPPVCVCGVCTPQLLQEYTMHLQRAQSTLRLRFKGEAPLLEERVANCLKRVRRYKRTQINKCINNSKP